MSQLNERGANSERNSALWGTGGRGGDRSSVLWGKGGRGVVVACVFAFVLAAPLAALASSNTAAASTPIASSFIAPSLLNAKGKVDVIIQSWGGLADANAKATGLGVFQKDVKQLSLVNGVAVTVPAAQLKKLQGIPGIIVTPDSTMQVAGGATASSTQMWPYESGNAAVWAGDLSSYVGKTPAIAVVDSGVQQNRADFGNRLLASVNVSTIAGNTSTDDQRGHGTFVAGIAAGAASDLTGASPVAPIVSVKVMDQNGQAKTSDVITACQWILDNKAKYNIRVANFSLHSSYGTNFYRDPLDQAVEKLWFNNVVVVAAAGNYGTASGPSGVKYSPGNDPFVITVGAVDIGNSMRSNDDTVAPWSAWGYTYDGFYKPDVAAPGRYMVGPIAPGSTITAQKASNMIGTDRIQLSGTSFAAPVVSGTVADMLARHPNWTPDQVKGALMRTARAVHNGNPRAAGLGEITASRAVTATVTPNPNAGLERFVSTASGSPAFDATGWSNAAKASMSWNSMSWADQSWSDQSWSDQAWAAMSWADMSWSDMSWADMSWADMSWADVSNEDAAEGDDLSGSAGYVAPTTVALDAATDPDTAVPVDGLDPLSALGVAPTATTDTSTATTDTSTATTDTSAATTDTSTTSTTQTVTDATTTAPAPSS